MTIATARITDVEIADNVWQLARHYGHASPEAIEAAKSDVQRRAEELAQKNFEIVTANAPHQMQTGELTARFFAATGQHKVFVSLTTADNQIISYNSAPLFVAEAGNENLFDREPENRLLKGPLRELSTILKTVLPNLASGPR